MKTATGIAALAVWGLWGVLAWTAAPPSSQAEPAKRDGPPAAPGSPAGEAAAPMLLDASLTVAGEPPSGADAPRERKDLVLPPPGHLNVTVDVLVDGRPLPTVPHAGKVYLPVPRTGDEYQIRVWNHGPRRVAAVTSVDGLSVITGRPASEHDPGYLVAPYGHIVIRGWRRNLEHVAAFRFAGRDRSYAGLVGTPDDIGVIGLVAIEERVVHPVPRLERRDAAAAKGFRTEVGSVGTEYGREVDSRAYYVPFVRSGNKQTVTLYYDTVEALRAAGVPVNRPLPTPFPGDIRFAPSPPGYRGK